MRSGILVIQLVLVLLLAGCSNGNPVLPSQASAEQNPNAVSSNRYELGIWEVVIDPVELSVEVVQIRNGNFHLNIRRYIEENPCSDCLTFEKPVVPKPYGADVDITINHPFDNMLYTVFDVRGIVMLEGSYEFTVEEKTYLTTHAGLGDPALLNPDGWTGLFNAQEYTLPGVFGYTVGTRIPPSWSEPTNTLNAFRAFYSSGQSEDEGGRRAFLPEDSVTRKYQLQIPGGQPFRFWYAVDASWAQPMYDPPYTLNDFKEWANCTEAYRFDVEEIAGGLYVDGGATMMRVKAWDHNGEYHHDRAWIAVPDVTGEIKIDIDDYAVGWDGNDTTYEFIITNTDGGLDASLGTELFVFYIDYADGDPFNGVIEGVGRYTIPVSETPLGPMIHSFSPGQALDYSVLQEATVKGENFYDGCTLHLERSGQPDIIATDIQFIDNWQISVDLDLIGVETGFWDVVITNSDLAADVFIDGLEVLDASGCNDVIHGNYLGNGDFQNGYLLEGWDACFVQGSGTVHDGRMLAYETKPGGVSGLTFNVDTPDPSEGVTIWENPIDNWHKAPYSVEYLESIPGFAVAWGGPTIRITNLFGMSVDDIGLDPWGNGMVYAFDIDSTDGFWAAVTGTSKQDGIHHYIPNDYENYESIYCLRYGGIYVGIINEILSIQDEKLLILNWRGDIFSFDVSVDPGVFVKELQSPFSSDLIYNMMGLGVSCDMAIDRSNPGQSQCRIIVMGNIDGTGVELVKIDADLNVLAGPVNFDIPHYKSMAINPETRNLTLWHEIDGSPGSYSIIEQPNDW